MLHSPAVGRALRLVAHRPCALYDGRLLNARCRRISFTRRQHRNVVRIGNISLFLLLLGILGLIRSTPSSQVWGRRVGVGTHPLSMELLVSFLQLRDPRFALAPSSSGEFDVNLAAIQDRVVQL